MVLLREQHYEDVLSLIRYFFNLQERPSLVCPWSLMLRPTEAGGGRRKRMVRDNESSGVAHTSHRAQSQNNRPLESAPRYRHRLSLLMHSDDTLTVLQHLCVVSFPFVCVAMMSQKSA